MTATLLLSSFGCSRYLSLVPEEAGGNRKELARVLEYYESDSLKSEAARFLIDNMVFHHSVENGIDFTDIRLLGYDFLTSHIDRAFELWEKSPYAKDLSFEEFKEYILPYRAVEGFGNNQTNVSRQEFLEQTIGLPDSISKIHGWILHYNGKIGDFTDFKDCALKANEACLYLRSIGIPCVVEHNLGYRTFKSHHYHCAAWDTKMKSWIKFDAEETDAYPGEGDWTSSQVMNMYRETFAPQKAMQSLGYQTPAGFRNPCMKEVTENTINIEIDIPEVNDTVVPFLTTFHRNDSGLQEFTFGNVKNGKAFFNYAKPDLWYVVTCFKDGKRVILTQPFFVDYEGNIECLDFDGTDEIENITLTRKYPVKEKLLKRIENLKGTYIEAADNPYFTNAQTLWTLKDTPHTKPTIYNFDKTGDFSFYRIVTPGKFDISELEWIASDGKTHVGSKNEAIYDGNQTTAPKDSTHIALQLQKPGRIEAVRLTPLNAGNSVTRNHKYKLYGWQGTKGWKLISSERATVDSIVFSGIPKGRLLWLKDITDGEEEMPFLIENNRQKFIY